MMARNGKTPAVPGRRLKRLLALLAALLLLWLGGALSFAEQVEHQPEPADGRTDAIVVLTGGTARLATALRLLNDRKAERLLVSGVGPTVTKASLLQAVLPSLPDARPAAPAASGTDSSGTDSSGTDSAGISAPETSTAGQPAPARAGLDLPRLFACCVDLGFEAADTAGNALETAGWLNAHGYRSIRLVTANYHMPRALVEFARRLPGVTILPHPVQPDAMRIEGWWQRREAAGFLLGEYSKYVAALVRARLDAAIAAALGENGAAPAAAPAPVIVPVQPPAARTAAPARTAPAAAPAAEAQQAAPQSTMPAQTETASQPAGPATPAAEQATPAAAAPATATPATPAPAAPAPAPAATEKAAE